jgi:hypothetical protein
MVSFFLLREAFSIADPDTGIRGPSPVLEYSGNGLGCRNADASVISLAADAFC